MQAAWVPSKKRYSKVKFLVGSNLVQSLEDIPLPVVPREVATVLSILFN